MSSFGGTYEKVDKKPVDIDRRRGPSGPGGRAGRGPGCGRENDPGDGDRR